MVPKLAPLTTSHLGNVVSEHAGHCSGELVPDAKERASCGAIPVALSCAKACSTTPDCELLNKVTKDTKE